nr:CPPV336 Immunoglobulin-like domain protein [Cooks petrelpox virus]
MYSIYSIGILVLLGTVTIKSETEVEVGSTIELKCSLPMENITEARWKETDHPTYIVSEMKLGGTPNNKDFLITVDALYSKDLSNSTLVIKNVKVSNEGCYTYEVISDSYRRECTRCFLVKTHVVFRWRRNNNITTVACYVGSSEMQPYSMFWKSKGVSVGGNLVFDRDEHEYKILNRYGSSEVKIMEKYDDAADMLWCRYVTYNGTIIEYPIRFLGTEEGKFHEVKEYRFSNNYW